MSYYLLDLQNTSTSFKVQPSTSAELMQAKLSFHEPPPSWARRGRKFLPIDDHRTPGLVCNLDRFRELESARSSGGFHNFTPITTRRIARDLAVTAVISTRHFHSRC
ncbi:hypothetical protein J6590_057098 [Homalodisca vitripennis]|nr:hypothetical protein J6590_057098 [Homalodisca vitripennis]